MMPSFHKIMSELHSKWTAHDMKWFVKFMGDVFEPMKMTYWPVRRKAPGHHFMSNNGLLTIVIPDDAPSITFRFAGDPSAVMVATEGADHIATSVIERIRRST